MTLRGIIWLRQIVDKLAIKHHVETHEVDEVLAGHPKVRFLERGQHKDEDVYVALGKSRAGRYLTVLFIFKKTREALILSARDMAAKERKLYAKK